ncbi:MAG: hypothetical protein GY788_07585 [bacterium]|nr:hypothetical protein [bacterium]
MNVNALGSEQAAVVATIDPDVLTAAAYSSDYVDMGKFAQILAIAMAGTLGTDATFDAKLVQATDSSGTGVKDISGKAITQLTEAGTDADKQALINCRAEELDTDNGFNHAALVITVAVATSDGGGVVLGMNPRHAPASDNDLASVDEIV